MRDRLPLILSTTALVVAVFGSTPLGRAAYRAVVPSNSVGTKQLQHNAVSAGKIAPNAVRTGHVLNGSLLAADFKAGQLPSGPQGPKGDKGDKGDKGSKGDQGIPGLTAVEAVRTTATIPAGAYGGTTANCPTGKAVLGGGVNTSNVSVVTTTSRPLSGQWEGRAFNTTAAAQLIEIYAVCATASP